MIIDLVGSTGGSAFTINKNHIFADNTARDSYFALNPTEKEDGILISVGSGFQEYNGANWIEKSPILKGNKGDKGDKGDTGEQGLQGIQGVQGLQGISGQDASEIVSANFIGNDMVFSKDDTTTFSIINAKVSLTPNIDNKQDLLVSGDNIKTISGKTIIGSGDLSITGDDIDTSTSTKKMITQPLLDKLSGMESGAEVNDVNSINGKVGIVTLNQDDITDGSLYVRMTPAEKSKLGNLTDNFKGLFANSTARDLAIINPQNGNYVIQEDTDSIWYYSNTWTDTGTTSTGDMSKVIYDPQNINGDSFNRNNHTGTQLANTISDFNTQVSNNTDVINSFKKNIDTLDNIQDGITYVKTTNDFTNTEKSKLAGIEPNATGDQTANEILTLIKTVDGTGSGLDADLLGGQSLANIQSSINSKQDTLISSSNIKTINGNSILGSGNIEIIGGGTGAVDSVNGQVGIVVLDADDISDTSTTNKFVTSAEKTNIANSANHIINTSNPHNTNKSQVGLGNVQNLAPLDMPISTATQTALNLKEAIANKNSPNGYCGLDSNGKVDISRIPVSALERMVYVADEVARFNLTINSAQNGDVVKQQDTGVLYFIVDDTNLNNSSGYEAFTAGTAGAVEWTNILNKPSDIFYTTTMNADSISTTTSTNKFTTQSDINKLSGIESGAEVNNISEANAIALTNNGDTSIHYHSSDRIRANHTGTQPASTISDFNTAVAGTPSVTANTAKVSFPEAPNDGSYYARKSLGWSPVLYTENTIFLENPTAPNVASGDNSTKVANTAFVNAMLGGNTIPAKNLATNGYVKMANGLIIQWVKRCNGTGAGLTRINFPIAFPNALFNVQVTDIGSVTPNVYDLSWDDNGSTNSYADIYATAGTCVFTLFAIGY